MSSPSKTYPSIGGALQSPCVLNGKGRLASDSDTVVFGVGPGAKESVIKLVIRSGLPLVLFLYAELDAGEAEKMAVRVKNIWRNHRRRDR